MSARTFLDTNVLVYTDDHDNPVKQATALALVESGHASGNIVISSQVLGESAQAATKKLRVPVAVARAKIELFALFEVAGVDVDDIVFSSADAGLRRTCDAWRMPSVPSFAGRR